MDSEKPLKNRQYCIAFGCHNANNRNPELAFFSLPKDEERRRQWLLSLDRQDLLNKKGLKHKSHAVCSEHFDHSQIRRVKLLKADALPKCADSEKPKKSRQYCIALDCFNSNKRNPEFAYFSLPKDEERRRQWLTSLDRQDLLNKKGLKYKSHVVCSAHFDNSQIKIVKHLKTDVVPKCVDGEGRAAAGRASGSLSLLKNILLTVKHDNRSVKTQTDSTLDTHAAQYLADVRTMKRTLQQEYSECKRRKLARLQRSDVLFIEGGGGGDDRAMVEDDSSGISISGGFGGLIRFGGGERLPASPQHTDCGTVTVKVERDSYEY